MASPHDDSDSEVDQDGLQSYKECLRWTMKPRDSTAQLLFYESFSASHKSRSFIDIFMITEMTEEPDRTSDTDSTAIMVRFSRRKLAVPSIYCTQYLKNWIG